MNLVGFIGAKGAGKDTAAAVLLDSGYLRVAFADALREEVSAAFGVSRAFLEERDTKETPSELLALNRCADASFVEVLAGNNMFAPRSPRWILQQWGTEYRRNLFGDGYWVEKTAESIKRALAVGRSVVVTDVRFPNEARKLSAMGATLVAIIRPCNPFSTGDQHASETQMVGYPTNFTVYNNGSEAGLKECVRDWLRHRKFEKEMAA